MKQVIKIYKQNLFYNFFFFFFKGALTNKPHSFNFRAWELETIQTKIMFDSFVDDILVQLRGFEVMRILPITTNFSYNWITDKTRFFFDSLKYQRIHTPFFSLYEDIFDVDWLYVLLVSTFFFLKMKQNWLKFVTLKMASLEVEHLSINPKFLGFSTSFFSDLNTLKNFSVLSRSVGSGTKFLFNNSKMQSSLMLNVFTNENFDLFMKEHQFIFLIGLDLRYEMPKFYLFLKQKLKIKNFKIFVFNVRLLGVYNFNYIHLGFSLNIFVKMLEGRHWINNFLIKNSIHQPFSHFFLTGGCLDFFFKLKLVFSLVQKFCVKFNLKWFCLYTQTNFLNLSFLNFRQNLNFFHTMCLQNFLNNQRGILFYENFHKNFKMNFELNKNYIYFLLNSFSTMEVNDNFFYKITLPMLTFFERDFLTMDLFGKVSQIKGFLPACFSTQVEFLELKTSFDFFFLLFCIVNLKTKTNFLTFLNTVFSSERCFIFTVCETDMLSTTSYGFTNCCLDNVVSCFIPNFYKMEEFSKNSLILNNVNNFFYKNYGNYLK